MASTVLTLEQLPEDVLLMVMGFVSVEDVLACRLVCKALCGLALHPDVWRHRSLKDDEPHALAVLHLAPCLDELAVSGLVPTLAVTTTRCAAASLYLLSEPGVAFSIAEYALAVRNQESLGRLRRLELRCSIDKNTTPNDVLMRTVASCSGLEWIEIGGDIPDSICHPVVHGPPRPSLKYFHCPVTSANAATFVNTILAGHAATLETVNIESSSHLDLTATADLLAAMPRLRSLRCDAWSVGLEAVAACKTLIDVSISMSKDLDELGRVARFVRRAKQLRWFYVEYFDFEGGLPAEYCTMLVDALAPGRSQLEQLSLDGFKDVRPLLRALPMLPALRHLDLCADPDDELLRSITPVTAPALRLLEIGIPLGQCPHAWMHGDAVKATLAENPSLHIQLWCRPLSFKCDPQDCRTCVIGCHREVKWGEVGKIGLYSHDPDMCPSPRDHTADDTSDWQRAFDRSTDVECLWIHM
ncbi:uncharacterized protein LOC113202944 [Frankliniella occidentalis]|uniref:Uncharacterized protein LOC113202944 n=1 Tax=Frankliniella occidentalis TaxID=133901 RepID=A0A6J1RWI3_FRAOC|nr:uncharacterized protein LOC113202944 [Frankliniella occidentalis]